MILGVLTKTETVSENVNYDESVYQLALLAARHSCDSVWQHCDRCEEHSEELFAFGGERVRGKCLRGSTSFLSECNKEKEQETYAPSRAIFNDAMVKFDIKSEKSARYDMHTFLSREKDMIEKILRDELRKRKSIRVFFSLTINLSRHFAKDDSSVQRKSQQQNFDTPVQNLHNKYDISFCFEKSKALLISQVEKYLRDGSRVVV